MMSTARARRFQPAKASRQALTLCEASMLTRPRVSPRVARAALRAAGLPPHLAARLRARLRLQAEPEDGR
jgi:hypothetical protein